MSGNFRIAVLDEIDATACPCGLARRAFADLPGGPASVHLVEVRADAAVHYHTSHTEIYVVLKCADHAAVELDGERHVVRRMTALLIPPGVRHRALGRMKILNVVIPPYDAADEHVDT